MEMNELNLKFKIYPYGKTWNTLKGELDESKKEWIAIYTNPPTFGNVPLNSLEGYFVLFGSGKYELKDGTLEDMSNAFPRLIIKRKNMSSFEKKVVGEFISLYEE